MILGLIFAGVAPVLAIHQELDIPVKLIGFGEKIDDIGEFKSEEFMRGLLEGLV